MINDIFSNVYTKVTDASSHLIVSRQSVHLHESALRIQNQLVTHQHIFRVTVSRSPKLKQSLMAKNNEANKYMKYYGRIITISVR